MELNEESEAHCDTECIFGPYKTVEVRSIFEIADANTIRFQNFERRQGKALKKEDFAIGRLKRNSSLLRPVSPCSHELAFEFPMGLYFPEDKYDHMSTHKACQNIHEGPVEDLFDIFDTDPETGLHTAQVNINSKIYGPNVTQTPISRPQSLYWIFLHNIFQPFTWIIWICSILSGTSYIVQLWTNHHMYSIIDNAIACACLLVIALLSTCLGFLYERSIRRQLYALKEKTMRTTTVLRNSRKRRVPNAEIVVGDIIEIHAGDIIPADIRIIQSDGLKVDEAMIKGESKPRTRSSECTHENPLETENLAFASTLVVEGTATGIVIATGDKTTSGSFVEMAAKLHPKTPLLTQEIRSLLEFFTFAILSFVIIDVSCSILLQKAPIHIFVDSVNLIIIFMPFCTSIGMTVFFWRTSQRFARNSSIVVKNPDALRALGLTNVLCVDKTGTLTKHHLSVTHLYFNNEILENIVSEDQPDFEDDEVLEAICNSEFQALEAVAILCNSAQYTIGRGQNCLEKRVLDGDYVDKALIHYFEMYRTDAEYLREQYQLIYDQKFNSKRKFQACLYKKKGNPLSPSKFDSFIFVMKGAPEAILKYCTSILVKGQEHPLTEEWIWEIKKAQKYLTSVGEIVVGFCDLKFKDVVSSELELELEYGQSELSFHSMLRRGLRFVGLISMFDPPRPGVREAIKKCKAAGIKVIMLTGDHADTSKAIAHSVGILSQGPRETFPKGEKVAFGFGGSSFRPKTEDKSTSRSGSSSIIYHGIQLYSLSELDLQMDLKTYSEIIFARLSPQQKFSIVKTLQDMGYLVTMVGDGMNDAPALKQADLGVAIGIETNNSSINQVQDSSDIIIKDGNFYGLVEGMELSRSCAAVLKRMFFYCMADSLPFVVALLGFSTFRVPMAISLVMILLLRICIDLMAVLVIPFDLDNFNCWKNENENGGPAKDSICSHSLLSFTFGQIGMVETLAGFATYFIIYAQNGFLPLKLVGLERNWDAYQVNDLVDSYGQEWTYGKRKELEMVGCLGFFMAVAVCQCANLFVCQSRINGPFWKRSIRSYPLTIMSFVVIAVTAFFVYIPFLILPSYHHTVFFRFDWWFISIPFFLFIIIYDEIRHHLLSSPVFKSEFRF